MSSSTSDKVEADRLRLLTVMVLYFTYLCYYLARKADAISKTGLTEDVGFTLDNLAAADTSYLFVYTFALFLSGMIGARVPSQYMLSIGLLGVALVSALKGRTSDPTMYALLQGLHAVFQSTGWPTCIKVLAVWVNRERGTVMGFWTTCQSLGGVLGSLMATWFSTEYGWRWAYHYHVPILIVMALVVLISVRDEPPTRLAREFEHQDARLVGAKADLKDALQEKKPSPNSNETPSLSQILALPGVLMVGTSYFFLKFLRYALLFWLPFYYSRSLGYDNATAGYLSTSFEIGGAFGTPLIGVVSDKFMNGRRDLTAGIFMLGATFSLMACIVFAQLGPSVNALAMALTGVLVIGPDSVLSGTIAQDIGQRSGLGTSAVGSVAGLLNSIGSAGSIFQSGVTAWISRSYGWPALFLVFVACSGVSSAILFRVAQLSSMRGNGNNSTAR